MVNGRDLQPGTDVGARGRGPRRGCRAGTGPGLVGSAGRHASRGYVAASLAVLALVVAWFLGVTGCTGPGAGARLQGTPGAMVRPSSGEVSRLTRTARYYRLMGQPDLGLKEIELAHQQNPNDLQILNLLAQSYEDLGKFEAARKLYEEALARQGSNPAIQNNLCFSYYQEGRWQEAENCFRHALARDPRNQAARNNLGLLYCRLGRQDEARRLWQEVEGPAVADAKMGQVLAALGMKESPASAREPEPALAMTQEEPAPAPQAAAAPLPAPAPAPARIEMVKPLAAKPETPAPAPTAETPAPPPQVAPKEATKPVAVAPAAPAPSPKAVTPAPTVAAKETVKPVAAKPETPAPAPKAVAPAPQVTPKEATKPVAVAPAAPAPSPKAVTPAPTVAAKETVKPVAAKPETPAPAPKAETPAPQAPLTDAVLKASAIEVRNGTQSKNLAQRTRTLLREEGFKVAKIGKHVNAKAAKTVIYYRSKSETVARALADKVFPDAELTRSAKLKKGMDIKVLLGRDLLEDSQFLARLHDGPAAAPPPPAPVAATPQLRPLTTAQLVCTAIEVRNGNGAKDLAHQARTLLQQEGFTVAEIGNHVDFGAAKTVIYFRPDSESVAQAVGAKIFPGAELERSLKLAQGVDIKILLGADLLQRPPLMARLVAEGK